MIGITLTGIQSMNDINMPNMDHITNESRRPPRHVSGKNWSIST